MKLDFFIDRPVFSTVLSTVIVIVGIVGLVLLPVDQYPQIVPPVVKVSSAKAEAQLSVRTNASRIASVFLIIFSPYLIFPTAPGKTGSLVKVYIICVSQAIG